MRLVKKTAGKEWTVYIDLTTHEMHFTPTGEMVFDFQADRDPLLADTWFRVETNTIDLNAIVSHCQNDLLMGRSQHPIWLKGDEKTITNDSGSYTRVTVTEWRYLS